MLACTAIPAGGTVAVAGAGRPASPTLQVVVAPYRPVARFAVSYSGTGTWVTTYHATPPNPGGMHDTNDAADSSTERWSLDYLARLSVPVCGSPGRGRPDRCSHLVAPTLARGPTSVAGVVDHNHVDGLYRFDDAAARCQLAATPPPAAALTVPLHVTYDPRRQTIGIAPSDPVAQALSLVAPACPGYPDGIDGLLDNYFTPGFSFSAAYGPDRWFKPAPVAVRLATLRRAARITVQFGPTTAGTPPTKCDVRAPAVEQCHTAGAWAGVLTLVRVAQS